MGAVARRWMIVSVVSLAAGGVGPWIRVSSAQVVAPRPTGGPSPQQATDSRYEVVAPGLLGNAIVRFSLDGGALRLVMRDLVMGPGEAKDIPIPSDALMELRGGAIVTTIDGQAQSRQQGDFWEVPKGSRLSFKNVLDVAIVRAIYFEVATGQPQAPGLRKGPGK